MLVATGKTTDQIVDEVELTILMPCLDEAETIATCVDKAVAYVTRSGIRAEVLVADNGSIDGSPALAAARGARVIHVTKRGYGAALRAGIRAARGRYVIMGDADDSYDFTRLDAFVAKLRDGYDLVMGNRFRGGIAAGAMPFLHRYLGNPVLSLIGRLFFGVGVGDFHCGLRGFDRRRMIDLKLHTAGMEFASEMVIAAAVQRYAIAEVPTTLAKDGRSRQSHLRTWRDGWRHLRFLLIFCPRWLFLYPGLFLIALGLLDTIVLFPGPLQIATGVRLDIKTFVVGAMAMLVGVQIVGFGLIARRLASLHGFLPDSKYLSSISAALTLDRGLVIAGLLIACGMAGVVWAFSRWISVDFGPLTYPPVLRGLILSLTAVAIGVQLAFTSFLLGIVDLPLQRDAADDGAV
jgi:glycosyltransferase involved in cell wall biosynthesis